jgi:hypothetical protein
VKRPEATGGATSDTPDDNGSGMGVNVYSPYQMRVAYGVESLYKKGMSGKGQTVVIIDSFGSPTLQKDLDVFSDKFNLPKVTDFYTDFGQDERLFARYRALASTPAFAKLDAAQRRLVDNALRDFRLSGAELPPERKAALKLVDEELATLSARYEDNVLDATNAWELVVEDRAALDGVPDDVIETARRTAADEGKAGWKLTLHMPCYMPVMQYARNADVREKMYRAYATRASEFGNAEWDNSAVLTRTLELRRAAAPVDQRADAHHRAAERLGAPDDLADGATRGHHVLDHQASLAGGQREPAPEPHDAVLPLGEERARAEGAGHFVGDHDAADRRRQNGPDTVAAERRRERLAERGGVNRVLQHQRGLQIDVRVKPGGEPEVAVQQGAGGLVEIERLAVRHGAASSARIALAATAGSRAPVIGRPTTR